MNIIVKVPTVFLSLLVFLPVTAYAGAGVVKDMAKTVGDAVFSEAERQIIEKYYEVTKPVRDKEHERNDEGDDDDYAKGKKNKNKAKGKGKDKWKGKGKNKQKAMPKGIVMKLERGGAVPPGIAKTRLPSDLEQQLPPAPKGFERIESEGKVILADIATGVIADIIRIAGKSGSTGEKSIKRTEVQQPEEKKPVQEKTVESEKSEKKWWQIWKD